MLVEADNFAFSLSPLDYANRSAFDPVEDDEQMPMISKLSVIPHCKHRNNLPRILCNCVVGRDVQLYPCCKVESMGCSVGYGAIGK